VAIGVFDGVHLGHRAIVEVAAAQAEEGIDVVPLTFWPHPLDVVGNGAPQLLCDFGERVRRLHDAGADHVKTLRFDSELAAETPDEFFERWIVGDLKAVAVTVGENFRFGAKAAGDTTTLRELGTRHGVKVTVVPTVDVMGTAVSSSLIRDLVSKGAMEEAAAYLGRPFLVSGEVVRGAGRGRQLGFPTANIDVAPGLLLPAQAVYGGHAQIDGEWLPAAISVGTNPQFHDDASVPQLTVEAHVVDWDGDLYGKTLPVRFERWIRGQGTFPDVDALVSQIAEDCQLVRTETAATR
jgi:riboflavin kinase/FMN adenylyltransferase